MVISDGMEVVVVLEENLPPVGHGRSRLVDFAALNVDGTLECDHLAGNKELLSNRADNPWDQPLSDVNTHII